MIIVVWRLIQYQQEEENGIKQEPLYGLLQKKYLKLYATNHSYAVRNHINNSHYNHMSGMYKVQRIVGKKLTEKNQVQYKVKWKGYPDSQCTWEPVRNLRNVQDMIDAFQKKNEKLLNEALRNNQYQKISGRPKTTKESEEARSIDSVGKPRKLVKRSQVSVEKTKSTIRSSDQDKSSQLEDYYVAKPLAESNNQQSIEQMNISLLQAGILELMQKKEQERLHIIDMFKGDNGDFKYKVTKGKQNSIQQRDYIVQNHIDQLLAFYESRIQFQEQTD